MLKNDKVSFKEVEDLENKYSDAVVKFFEIFEENEKKTTECNMVGTKKKETDDDGDEPVFEEE